MNKPKSHAMWVHEGNNAGLCVISGYYAEEMDYWLDALEAENARLRAALEKLADESNLLWTGTIVQEFARAALGKE
jgi:cell division protein FtsB